MKVFISWSGDLSRELGEALRDWLPAVIQSVKPFFTPSDIEKGSRWGKDIAQELEKSSVGIFCLTKDNLSKPWLMFEAGALSKNLDVSKVCPLLYGVDNTDLEGPLVQFQASPFEKTEIKKLLKTINSCLGDQRLDDSVLNDVFEMWWPKLEGSTKTILEKYENSSSNQSVRSDRDILEEVLELSRLGASSIRNKSGRLHSAVVKDFVDVTCNVVNSINEGERRQDALESIKGILKPLRYLIRQGDFPRSTRYEFLEKLDSLEFGEPEEEETDDE